MKSNHIFSFPGGDLLANMAAWWFVSYSYYLHIDRTHFNWQKVGTVDLRRGTYNKSRKYHVYWLCEVLSMERLDVHRNKGNLSSAEIKRMASEVLAVLSKDNGISETQVLLDELISEYEKMKK